jgi:polyhydroxyalkanoate synthesis repressor PhaR
MSTIVKRYPNRKMYNTDTKKYITLEGIAGLIRDGQDVQILDHTTGEDLTALTLTQIIFEQEKKQGGFLPRSVLTGLVQAGGETLTSLRRTLSSPLELLRHVDQEIERRLQWLVEKGELTAEESTRLREKLLRPKTEEATTTISEQDLEQYLHQKGVPTRDDLQHLNMQLEELVVKLEQLTPDQNAS